MTNQEVLRKHNGNMSAAAKELGIPRSTLRCRIANEQTQVLSGHVPTLGIEYSIPPPLQLSGTSQYFAATETSPALWLKTKVKEGLDTNDIEELAAHINSFRHATIPLLSKAPNELLATQYTITDLHVAMLAWGKETGGDDWDLSICEQTTIAAMTDLTQRSPDSKTGILLQNGDYFHSDSMLPVTPKNRNILSQDGRFLKMYEVGINIMIEVITMLLNKHEHVVLIMGRGNHDPATSQTMRTAIRAIYAKNERVTVIGDANPFYVYEFGNCFIGAHHGDMKGFKQLPSHFSNYFSEAWGRTKHRYIHTGHKHCLHVVTEFGGCKLWQHPTLAAADDHGAHNYDVAGREIMAITYHKEKGFYSTVNYTV